MPEDPLVEQLRDRLDATEEPTALDAVVETMVYEVQEVIATLIKTVCMGDSSLYRPMLETIAQRLGDV